MDQIVLDITKEDIESICASILRDPVKLIRKYKIAVYELPLSEKKACEMIKSHYISKKVSKVSFKDFVETFLVIKFLKKTRGFINFKKWEKFLKNINLEELILEIK